MGTDWAKMKPDKKDAIINELERALIVAGAKDYDSGMAAFGKILGWVQEHYHPMRSKQDFGALLDSFPDPSRLQMRFLLGTLKYLPQLARFFLKRAAEITEQDLPPIPTGRPGLDAFTKAQIIARIGKSHMNGYTLDQAKMAAAVKSKVSRSTVQRAWDDRGNRGAVDFRSVLKFLAEDEKEQSDGLDSTDESEK
jgi:hypothetical protein